MRRRLRIEALADHPETLRTLAEWFEEEWPAYYGPSGSHDARADLAAYANRDLLPIGVVALLDGEPCGVAAVKADSIASHAHLGPWVAAGLVARDSRRKGVGAALLSACEDVARSLGHRHVYCATATAEGLLARAGWRLVDRAQADGEDVAVYRKEL